MSLTEKIRSYTKEGHISFHMPGHKNNFCRFPFLREIDPSLDITEIGGFDDFNHPSDFFLEMEKRAERIWNSSRSFVSVNGSTALILSALRCAAEGKKKRKFILSRISHKSVYHALEILDGIPVYINSGTLYGKVSSVCDPDTVEKIIENNPDACAVIVTSPTYEGFVSDIKKISEICHEKSIPLIVDESHGGHFGLNGAFPPDSVACGADIVIHSLHKTLFSLTQTAVAHLNGKLVSGEVFRESLDIFQSSSPSYLLSASAYETLKILDEGADELFEEWYRNAAFAKKELGSLEKIKLLESDDFSRFVIMTDRTDLTGIELSERLRFGYGIDAEMAASDYIICMSGPGNIKEDFDALAAALRDIEKDVSLTDRPLCPGFTFSDLPEMIYTPGEASFTAGGKTEISLETAEGKTAAENIYAYPPGIPILVKGEKIRSEEICIIKKMLKSGLDIRGIYRGEKIRVILH